MVGLGRTRGKGECESDYRKIPDGCQGSRGILSDARWPTDFLWNAIGILMDFQPSSYRRPSEAKRQPQRIIAMRDEGIRIDARAVIFGREERLVFGGGQGRGSRGSAPTDV
jgi:hypothetical protein